MHSLKRQILVKPSNKKSQVRCPTSSLPHQFLPSISCIELSSVLNNMLVVFIYWIFSSFRFFFCRINIRRRGFKLSDPSFLRFSCIVFWVTSIFAVLLPGTFFNWTLELLSWSSNFFHVLQPFLHYFCFFLLEISKTFSTFFFLTLVLNFVKFSLLFLMAKICSCLLNVCVDHVCKISSENIV